MPVVEGRYPDGEPSAQASQDGQGEAESMPSTKPEPRYIYYRLYTQDGPLESNNPKYSTDLSISHISSKSVRPPHTAASLKRCICKFEGLEGPENCSLYLSLSEKMPLDDPTRVLLRSNSGPGLSKLNPVVLVLDDNAIEKRSKSVSKVDPEDLLEWKAEHRYVYYRLYDDDSDAVSKLSFDKNDCSLGRINTLSIPPPYTVASLKHCLIKAEGISAHDKQLLQNQDSEIAMDDGDALALLTDNFPGFKEDQPMVFTYSRKPHVTGGTITAVAEYDYDAREDNEISFREGDRITEIELTSDDWWRGKNQGGEMGLFPSNHVEVQK